MPLSSCPCPLGSFCNLATNQCMRGCVSDDHCGSGTVCDVDARSCVAGCRGDGDCGSGTICDADARSCVAGCRGDGDCGSGTICDADAKSCVAGCRADRECGMGRLCVSDACVSGCRINSDCGPDGRCSSIPGMPGGTCLTRCAGFTDLSCGAGSWCAREWCSVCGEDEADPQVVVDDEGEYTLLCGPSDVDELLFVYDCGGVVCPDDTRMRWNITTANGVRPTCEYRVETCDGTFRTLPSTLTLILSQPSIGDTYTCRTTDSGPLFECASAGRLFLVRVGLEGPASGDVMVQPIPCTNTSC